jgi:hypothetical protein
VAFNDNRCATSGYSREEPLRMRFADLEAVEMETDTAAHIARILHHMYHLCPPGEEEAREITGYWPRVAREKANLLAHLLRVLYARRRIGVR